MHSKIKNFGFTIVELLIVIVTIGIIAGVMLVSYFGITDKANTATLQSDLKNASTVLRLYNAEFGSYPATGTLSATSGKVCLNSTSYCFKTTGSNTIANYTGGTNTYALQMSQGSVLYQVGDSTAPVATLSDGSVMQTINSTICPLIRTRAVDARDNHTYWVQKLADGKCWMLTNLGYSGSGTNTYGDVITLTNGTGGAATYTVASYYPPTGSNVTTEPTSPSTSTNGTGQYGYLYNWCAAMGAQTTTSACANATTPAPSASISICPSGWRLPVVGEFSALNSSVNNGSTTSYAGLIAGPWLGQVSGWWSSSFNNQGLGGEAEYWSSTQYSATSGNAFYFRSASVNPASYILKNNGIAVRCIAY